MRSGELVAIPTETVYGLAANALDGGAVRRIFAAKGRPQDNPLIVHIADMEELPPLVAEVPELAEKLAKAYWPGPLTMIFRKSARIPDEVSAGLSTVAVRMPFHPLARAVIRAAGVPLAAPSANLSGSPSPTTAAHVLADMAGAHPRRAGRRHVRRWGGIHRGGRPARFPVCFGRAESPRRCWRRWPEGCPSTRRSPARSPGAAAASPGMKYKHYAPKAHVVLIRGTPAAYAAFVNSRRNDPVTAMCFDGEEGNLRVPYITYGRRDDPAEQAHRVFDALRRLDDIGAGTVYCACPSEEGMGLAVYNRLPEPPLFEVIDVDG